MKHNQNLNTSIVGANCVRPNLTISSRQQTGEHSSPLRLSIHNSKAKEKTTHFCVVFVAPLVGLEPTTTTRCGALNFCSHCQATLQNSDRCRVLFAPFIRHRRRSQTNQLTARLLTSLSIHNSKAKEKTTHFCVVFVAPLVGLEPTTTRLTAECSTD